MTFNSYMSWLKQLKTIGLSDIIFGNESEIKENTLCIGINDTQRVGVDNDYMITGYTYTVSLYVTKADSPFIEKVSELLTTGLSKGTWNEKYQMYIFSGLVSIAGSYRN
ncbi:hypothetical protein LSG16_04800 [Lactococcus cremoris]|uniref:hypothetical protein n=1 Tax=Lactococcus lactis subsp. cremoris TaxID=1359 RepID=UPI001E6264FE|nr:hypothetical protein [Lactococcus cremoris]MCD6632151.1 hypothetical protein [Lactococcus cremoris]